MVVKIYPLFKWYLFLVWAGFLNLSEVSNFVLNESMEGFIYWRSDENRI